MKQRSPSALSCLKDWNSTSVAVVGAAAIVAAGVGFVLGVTSAKRPA